MRIKNAQFSKIGRVRKSPAVIKRELDIKDRNSRVRQANIFLKTAERYKDILSKESIELLVGLATEVVAGQPVIHQAFLDRTYSATDLANELGVSAKSIGMVANRLGLKRPEYGISFYEIYLSVINGWNFSAITRRGGSLFGQFFYLITMGLNMNAMVKGGMLMVSRATRINNLLLNLKIYLERLEWANLARKELLMSMRALEMESRRWGTKDRSLGNKALEVANLGLAGQCFQEALDELEPVLRG